MKTKINEFWNKIPPHGQSLVELALFFPIILMMLSGLIEFGFMLNQYLNLMDGPREGARFAVDLKPFIDDVGTDSDEFYYNAAYEADPVGCDCTPGIAQIVSSAISPYSLDPATDEIVISVVSIYKMGKPYGFYPTTTSLCPLNTASDRNSYCYFGNFTTKLSETEVRTKLGGATLNAGPTGAVIVEMYYHYHQQLALPWITVFVPDPVLLHFVSVAPLPAAVPPSDYCDPLIETCP